MDNNIKCNTSFWSEITEYKIQVPYYQRDYAQGRIDGRIDNIRKVFVEELYGALQSQNKCHLGLVFGSYGENEKVFIAVDGQQRLTTVFLLHWYVAWHENKLNDYKEKLSKFSWDTRSYSSQFVKLLFNIQLSDKVKVIDAIKTNSNYFSVWENDPTVKGMLTMLEEIESQYPQNDCNLCNSLFAENCNIQYDILKLEKDSDGKTYLKMNSRGRSLTTFELFKSKFLDKYHPDFGQKFDNEWLNFMLEKFATKDSQFSDPDIPFMNFINEYTYLQLKLKSDSNNPNDFKEFTDAKVKDGSKDVPFISFEKYNDAFKGNWEIFGKSLDWVCQNYENIKLIDDEVRFSGSWFFIDSIIKKDNNLHYSHRAKLFAAFKYAELTGYAPIDTELYKKWTRVFRNLVANTDIDGSNIRGICIAINKINDSNIYRYLSNDGELTAFSQEQIKEEIEKAKQIVSGGNDWEHKIIEVEKYAFFKGAIRFLFTDGEGNINWCDFDVKWENAQKYFKEIPEQKNVMNEEFDNANLLKALINRFTQQNYWEVLNWHYRVFNNSSATWRYYLLNNNINRPVHEIMMGDVDIQELEHSQDEAQNRLCQLSNTNLLDFVIKKIPQSWIRNYHGHKAIFPSSTGVFLDAGNRDEKLHIEVIKLVNEELVTVPGTKFLYGSDIQFIYQSKYFQWHREGYVRLIQDLNECKPILKNKDGEDNQDNWYWFTPSTEPEPETFIKQLDCLIAQAYPNESDKTYCVNCQNNLCD